MKSWFCCSDGNISRYLKGTWNQQSFLVQAFPEGTIKVHFFPTHLAMRTLGCLALAKHPCSAEGTEGDSYPAVFGNVLSSLEPCWNCQDRIRAPATSGLMLVTWQHVCTWFELTPVNLQGTANRLRTLSGKSSGRVLIRLLFWCCFEHLVPTSHLWKVQSCFISQVFYVLLQCSKNRKEAALPKGASVLAPSKGAVCWEILYFSISY